MRQNSERTDTSAETTVTCISDDGAVDMETDIETDVDRRLNNQQSTIECKNENVNYDKCICQRQSNITSVRRTKHNICFSKREKIKCAVVVFISVSISVIINAVINFSVRQTPDTPIYGLETSTKTLDMKQEELLKERLCFECAMLRAYIDQWAWNNDVTQNRLLDECCFDDYLTLLRTFKFYTDVKVSQIQSEVSRTSHDMRQIHNAIKNISDNARKASNGTVTPQIIYHIPEEIQEMVGSLAQKKRSVLYLKSDSLVNSDKNHICLVKWSTGDLFFPIVQGSLELLQNKSGVMNKETGYYSIRAEIKFEAGLQPNQTRTESLRYYIKYRSQKGNLVTIETFAETFTFSKDRSEYKGVVYKVTRLRKGDRIEVHVYDNFVSRESGAHSISIIEES